MAAVLFAAEDREELAPSVQNAGAWEQALSALSEEQLRALLADAARRHADVQDCIVLMGKRAVDPLIHERWAAELREISRRAADRHGFIDYDHASDYSVDLQQYLEAAIGPLLETGLVVDAFALAGFVFAEAMSQQKTYNLSNRKVQVRGISESADGVNFSPGGFHSPYRPKSG